MPEYTASARERCACGAEFEEKASAGSKALMLADWRERHSMVCDRIQGKPRRDGWKEPAITSGTAAHPPFDFVSST
jgi:hypothetical protein